MSGTRTFSGRRGFTRTDLVVAMALVLLGGGVLLASAVRVRGGAARIQSNNNLKQLGLALHNCNSTFGKLPSALGGFFPGPAGTPSNGYGPCLFHILPYIEYANLYNASRTMVGTVPLFVSWTGAGQKVKVYQAPGDPTAATAADSTSYLANGLAVPQESALPGVLHGWHNVHHPFRRGLRAGRGHAGRGRHDADLAGAAPLVGRPRVVPAPEWRGLPTRAGTRGGRRPTAPGLQQGRHPGGHGGR